MTTITAKHVLTYATRHLACDTAIEWLRAQPADTPLPVLIDTCPKPAWVDWLIVKLGLRMATAPQADYLALLSKWDELAAVSAGILSDKIKSLVAELAVGDPYHTDMALSDINKLIAYHEGSARWLTYLYNFSRRGEPSRFTPFTADVITVLDILYRQQFKTLVDVQAVENALKEVLAVE